MVLYENEKLRLWNPETGELDDRKELEESERARIVKEGIDVQAMKQSEGWKLVEALLSNTCLDLKEKLAYEQDFAKLRRLQEAVKAYQNVLNFVDFKVSEGRAVQEQQSPEEG